MNSRSLLFILSLMVMVPICAESQHVVSKEQDAAYPFFSRYWLAGGGAVVCAAAVVAHSVSKSKLDWNRLGLPLHNFHPGWRASLHSSNDGAEGSVEAACTIVSAEDGADNIFTRRPEPRVGWAFAGDDSDQEGF
ncbi:hypothetical protein JW872_03765 [Candidatus Babeliales bacterium]|nr:hypothetical protein [Candidatus Babeliales bacterium]